MFNAAHEQFNDALQPEQNTNKSMKLSGISVKVHTHATSAAPLECNCKVSIHATAGQEINKTRKQAVKKKKK